MGKVTIILCVFLLASGANAGIVSGTIESVYNKVDELIDTAIFTTQAIIEKIRTSVVELTDKFTELLDEAVQRMNDDYQTIYNKAVFERTGKTLDEIIQHQSSTNDWSISLECKLIAQSLRDDIVDAAADTSACLAEKVEEGKGHFENITTIANDVLMELYLAKIEAKFCIDSIDGVTSALSAVVCLSKVSAKTSWINVKKIPELTTNFAKMSWLVSTFFVSQVYCSAANGFTGLSKISEKRIEKLEACIKGRDVRSTL